MLCDILYKCLRNTLAYLLTIQCGFVARNVQVITLCETCVVYMTFDVMCFCIQNVMSRASSPAMDRMRQTVMNVVLAGN